MYSNNILNFQESTTILKASTKKSGNFFNAPRIRYQLYTPEPALHFGWEWGSEKKQWQIWGRKATNFGWATSGWVICIIDYFWQVSAHQAHIAQNEPMSNIDQQGSSLGLLPTFPFP